MRAKTTADNNQDESADADSVPSVHKDAASCGRYYVQSAIFAASKFCTKPPGCVVGWRSACNHGQIIPDAVRLLCLQTLATAVCYDSPIGEHLQLMGSTAAHALGKQRRNGAPR